MPFTIYRHLLAELLKVFLLTTTVIVVVIAFGAAIKPLAENLLGPAATAKYIALATVPMLQFAIPFAGGFAATLVFHRFATDNEITAMACCGLSYRRIFAPVAALGLVLLILVFWLVNFAVPHFWTLLKQIVTKDATAIFAAAVDRGEALRIGDFALYADDRVERPVDPETGIERRLVLYGVAAIKSDDVTGKPLTEFTAETATVDLYRRGRQTWMKLAMTDATVFRADDGTVAIVPRATPDAVLLDRGFVRAPKFLGLDELIELRSTIDARAEAFESRDDVELVLAKVDGWGCVARQLAGGGRVVFIDEANRREYHVEGGEVREFAIVQRGDVPLVVTELERGVAARRATTHRIELFFDDGLPPGSSPRFDLAVSDPKVEDLRSREPIRARWPQRVVGVEVRGCPGRDWSSLGNEDAAAMVDEIPADTPGPVADLTRQGKLSAAALRKEVDGLRDDILSHLVQRALQAVSAPALLLLGAVLATWRRQSLPLSIYLLSFIPAIANILLLASGQQLVRGGSVTAGLTMMIAGTVVLILVGIDAYRKLARN